MNLKINNGKVVFNGEEVRGIKRILILAFCYLALPLILIGLLSAFLVTTGVFLTLILPIAAVVFLIGFILMLFKK